MQHSYFPILLIASLPYLARIRSLLLLAIPLAVRQIAQVGIGIVDTISLGYLGGQVLAAAGLGSTFVLTIVYIYRGVMRALNVLAAEAFGANESDRVSRITAQGFWLAGLVCVPLMLLLWFLPFFLLSMGLDAATVALTQSYLHAIVWGLPAAFGVAVLEQIASALSTPQSITQIMLLGTLMNALANYALIFGHWGFPQLGIAGAGYASAFVMWFNFSAAIAVVKLATPFRKYNPLGRLSQFDRQIFSDVLRLGCPVGLQHGADMGLITATALMMGYLGVAQLAANEIAFQTVEVLLIVAIGLSEALTTQLGQTLGRKDFTRILPLVRTGVTFGGVAIGLMSWGLWSFPEEAIAIYLDLNDTANLETIRVARSLLPVAAMFQLFFGLHLMVHSALLGLKDTRIPMFVNLFSYWCIGGTNGYLFGIIGGGGATGIWWGLTSGLAIATILLAARFCWLFSRLYRSK